MKKRKIGQSLFLVAMVAFFAVSCSSERTREDKVSTIISEVNAPFLVVNAMPGGLIEKSGALDGALPFTQEMLLSFFIDESVTGVDYDVDIQIIVAKGPSFTPNFYGIFKLKNEEAFVELLETEANAEVNEKDGFKYVIKESDQYVIVWDEEFTIVSSIPMDFAAMMSGGSGNGGMKAVDKNIALINAANDGDVNTEYKTFLENESDIAIHFAGAGFHSYLVEMSMGESEELEANRELLEGTNTDVFFNFNNGSIDIQFLSDLSDKVMEEMNFFGEGSVSSELLSFGNSTDPMMSMEFNTNLSMALDYSKEQMSEYDYEDFEGEIEKMGLTVESAKTGLTGEVVFMMDRVEIIEREVDWGYGDPYVVKEPVPLFAVVLGVEDKASLMTLMNSDSAATMTDGVLKKGDAYIVLTDNALFTTNDSSWAYKVQSGSSVTINDKAGVLNKDPFGMFVDFSVIAQMDDIQDVKAIVDQLQDFRAGGKMEEMNMSFMFKDDSKNALRILTETISNLTNGGSGEEYETLEAELEAAAQE